MSSELSLTLSCDGYYQFLKVMFLGPFLVAVFHTYLHWKTSWISHCANTSLAATQRLLHKALQVTYTTNTRTIFSYICGCYLCLLITVVVFVVSTLLQTQTFYRGATRSRGFAYTILVTGINYNEKREADRAYSSPKASYRKVLLRLTLVRKTLSWFTAPLLLPYIAIGPPIWNLRTLVSSFLMS